ncbi:universal stress protein family [Fulvivirga imtechensis AK7]|uniref:Universal stress protein family n=1 Tax=Fulvivirga imtechensis AK7 TaxID=1237149 RepID=L8JLF0_9BACT|nr:universal stress protein [Fulvivirga imtechensis]ELR68314.1 universal stress protein family [Fulvivirga imtechensis AK7]
MKKILVPVDFSRQAAYALEFAVDLAKKIKTRIDVLHVVEFPVGTTIDPVGLPVPTQLDADFLDVLKENAEKRMTTFLKKVPEDINTKRKVDVGNPYINITEYITEEDIDLVVMGTKGASGLKEFFIGSNAEKVVRMARCPVITMHEKPKANDIKDIVFATDFEDPSEELITELKRLQKLLDARLHLLRVNTPNNFERDRVAKPALEKTAKRYMLKDYTINIYNDVYEDQGILSFAQDIGADMIALGTHGRTGIKHLISGSIAEDLVNHATQPIWTYHIPKKK